MTFTIAAGEHTYEVVSDAVVRFQALVVGRVVDELTGRPPLERARVLPTLRGISPDAPGERNRFALASGRGGTFALTGVPGAVFPNLGGTGYDVDLVVDAPGYLHTPVTAPVPAGTTAFPVDAGDVLLRRDAVALKGRVSTGVPSPVGVPGVGVAIVDPAGLVGMAAPFASRHDAGLQLTPQPLTGIGPALDLTDDVQRGAMGVRLGSRSGLAVDEIVRIGSGATTEYAIVAGLEGPTDLTRPGVALLRAPLAYPHRVADGPARRVSTGAAGPPATFVEDAFAEDRVAFVDDPTLLPDGATALAAHADPTREEWVVVRRAAAQTNAAGDYRILPIGRTATVTVHVTPAGPAPPDQTHVLSYGQRENTLNLRV